MSHLLAALAIGLTPSPIDAGPSMLTITIKGTPLQVYFYKPKTYTGDRMIMVFHGTLRNADEYRNDAEKMGERFGALIIAPKFDSERFPNRRYHRGGILKEDGSAAPQDEWTYPYIPALANEVRKMENRPKMPFYLIGHSAGGQFLVRLAGFYETGAERVVAANPGSELFPTRDQKFGYGFGGLPPELSSDDVIRRYLAQPLTLYLGTGDCVWDEDLDDSPEAMAQGAGRYQRGLASFAAAKKLAEEKGWPFNWRIVTAGAVGHDHMLMFNHPQADMAIFGRYMPKLTK